MCVVHCTSSIHGALDQLSTDASTISSTCHHAYEHDVCNNHLELGANLKNPCGAACKSTIGGIIPSSSMKLRSWKCPFSAPRGQIQKKKTNNRSLRSRSFKQVPGSGSNQNPSRSDATWSCAAACPQNKFAENAKPHKSDWLLTSRKWNLNPSRTERPTARLSRRRRLHI